MAIVGYHLVHQFDKGDAWLNAVDPKYTETICHEQCAKEHELLSEDDPEMVDVREIDGDEAEAQNLVCEICKQRLIDPPGDLDQP